MNKKNPNQLYEVNHKLKRNNIYTNKRLNDGIQDLKCFSSPRPLSAEQPYQLRGKSAHNFLRSRQKTQRSPKPMKIGKAHLSNQENVNLYFDRKEYEQKVKSLPKPKPLNSRSAQKNIYVSKNVNTSYGKGNFKANYQNLFINYPYKGEQKSKQKTLKKDLYTKYKTKEAFKPSGNVKRAFTNQNELYQHKENDPYKPIDEQHMFRAKSPTNKYLSRFKWKPTTQFVKKVQQ